MNDKQEVWGPLTYHPRKYKAEEGLEDPKSHGSKTNASGLTIQELEEVYPAPR